MLAAPTLEAIVGPQSLDNPFTRATFSELHWSQPSNEIIVIELMDTSELPTDAGSQASSWLVEPLVFIVPEVCT